MPAMGRAHPAQPEVPQLILAIRLTLAPLQSLGQDALKTEGLPAISKIILIAIEITSGNAFNEIGIRKADDIFGCAVAGGATASPFPRQAS